jgi:ribosomal protein S12 methylthiotransferase accessory factor
VDKNSIRPIIVGSLSVNESETVVSLAREVVRIQVPGLLMAEIIRICDGQRSFEEILNLLEDQWNREMLKAFLSHLVDRGVLRDCCDMSGYVWPFVFNPSYFSQSATDEQISAMVEQACQRHRENLPSKRLPVRGSQLATLLSSRQSSRVFSGQTVELWKIIHMLWAGYGILGGSYDSIGFDRHTVPSAGALYPLRISLVLFRSSNDLESGVYDVAFSPDGSVGLILVSRDLVLIYQAFADPLILRGATGVIFINGSFGVTAAKYGNRALLYVPLEAGHVAQNIYLSAAESGVATVEIGGFLEESMQEALHLSEGCLPLTTVLFGEAGESLVSQEVHQPAVEVRWVVPKAGGYTAPFVLVFARWKQGALEKDDWSCGRSKDPFIAHAKAVAEAEE